LVDIRGELTKLKRDDYPNAGAVLLRVFFELAVVSYLERTGKLAPLIQTLAVKANSLTERHNETAHSRDRSIAKDQLSKDEAIKVVKGDPIQTFAPSPVTLRAFVHQAADLPSGEISGNRLRTDLFRLMLEQDTGSEQK
jgi:hypothetical protein